MKKTVKLFALIMTSTLLFSCGGGGSSEHVHNFSSEWTYDETSHWHVCSGCDEKGSLANHTFGEWVVDIEPTISHDGHKYRECTVCEYKQEEAIKYEPPVVDVKATRVYLDRSATELLTGNSYTINPVVFPNEATKKIKYVIEDAAKLKVENNVAAALKAGATLLTAYNDENDNDVKDEDEAFNVMAFSIKDGDPSISISMASEINITVDETKKLEYTVSGATPSGLDYGFYSDNEDVCTVSGGYIKGHRAGTANVSVTWQGYRGNTKVIVSDLRDEKGLRASYIDIEDSVVMEKSATHNLQYSISPSGAVDKVTFKSTNEDVASIDSNGKITAHKGGNTLIEAKTENNKVARTLVTIIDKNATYDSYYNNYYGDLTWENGEDLKTKLHNIISKDVTPLRYDTPNWETNKVADEDLYNTKYVDAVYTDGYIDKENTATGWQREHAFAASLMTGYSTGSAVKALGRATDFHNLFASSSGANGSRGNKNFGYANPLSAEYQTKEECEYVKKAFEPGDYDKGRLARAIFYMGVMYSEDTDVAISESWTFKGDDISTHSGASKSLSINSTEAKLQVVEDNIDYNRISLNEFMYPTKDENATIVEYYRSLVREIDPDMEDEDYDSFRKEAYQYYLNNAMPYAIGHLSDLLKWNSYPVDLLEVQHNESIYSYNSISGKGIQHNRNPFVDYPELVNYIYGDLKDQPGKLSNLTPTFKALEMDKDEINHYRVNSSEINSYTDEERPEVWDFNIEAVKNNLYTSKVTDFEGFSIKEVFPLSEDQIADGYAYITLVTPINEIKVCIKVTDADAITFDTCTWNYIDNNTIDHNKGSYGAYNNGVFSNAVFNGLSWTVTLGNAIPSDKITNSKTDGTKFGTADYPVGTLTFETNSSINFDGNTLVNAIYCISSTASGKTYGYEFFVGGVSVCNGTYTGSITEMVAELDEPLEGKVKIVLSNITAGVNIRGLAINVVSD